MYLRSRWSTMHLKFRTKGVKLVLSIFLVLSSVILNLANGTSDELNQLNAMMDTKWCYMPNHAGHIEQEHWPPSCSSTIAHPQSPINLEVSWGHSPITHHTPVSIPRSSFVFPAFSVSYRGNAIDVKPKMDEDKSASTIFSLPNNISFEFHSLHFHWGSRNDIGSEHTINFKSFPMEIHLSFYNHKFTDMADAHDHNDEDSVLSVAILVDVVDDAKEGALLTTNFLKQLAEPLKQMERAHSYYSIKKTLDMTSLFQSPIGYSYLGSYTGPSCRKCTWLILSRPLVVPVSHLEPFRKIKVAEERNNFRRLQSTMHREIDAWPITYI